MLSTRKMGKTLFIQPPYRKLPNQRHCFIKVNKTKKSPLSAERGQTSLYLGFRTRISSMNIRHFPSFRLTPSTWKRAVQSLLCDTYTMCGANRIFITLMKCGLDGTRTCAHYAHVLLPSSSHCNSVHFADSTSVCHVLLYTDDHICIYATGSLDRRARNVRYHAKLDINVSPQRCQFDLQFSMWSRFVWRMPSKRQKISQRFSIANEMFSKSPY